jgi:hypothetical protein
MGHLAEKKFSTDLPLALQASRHAANCLTGDLQRSLSSGFKLEQPLGSTTSLGRRVARRRTDVPFLLEAFQSSVHGADGHAASRALSNFAHHQQPVGISIQARQRKENDVFERSEKFTAFHFFWNVKQTPRSSQEENKS